MKPFVPPERLTSLKWAALDFDGCVAESKWTPENPTYEAGLPVEGALEKTLELVQAGFQITIHTARPWSDYSYVEAWLIHYGFPFRRIIMGKLLAHMYIDDRAVNSREQSWLPC
jgi:hypothetical protein